MGRFPPSMGRFSACLGGPCSLLKIVWKQPRKGPLPFVQMALRTENDFRINCACRSRYRYRRKFFEIWFLKQMQTRSWEGAAEQIFGYDLSFIAEADTEKYYSGIISAMNLDKGSGSPRGHAKNYGHSALSDHICWGTVSLENHLLKTSSGCIQGGHVRTNISEGSRELEGFFKGRLWSGL